ncbi:MULTISPECIES: phosphoribosylanthranilate isomerase [Pseudomonadaceae]|uniref:phosphoribosylanthranilate isomerase n=1 Tax=Pseudomonadaceae TaxID=135621 RepID=UPI00084A4540|nr:MULTISPECIES: phosphoribosylanthranilate isomerase [Pseudomonas]OEC52599.1 N-(5'-phosphoribosyl)anthranilate isomerase [Pseudomonas sp. ENNP23]
MSTVRVKICGITRVEDALAAVAAGADAIGLVFYAPSPRAVTAEQARVIISALPPFVTTVGLFVDMPGEELDSVLATVPLDLLQFHGDESPDVCRRHGRPYLKALRIRPGDDVPALIERYSDASGVLLDTYVPGTPGGTGEAFDWSLVPSAPSRPVVLAGGLTPGNVAEAIRRVRPYAVDVSGGVEAAKGIKDPVLIRAFIDAVRTAA